MVSKAVLVAMASVKPVEVVRKGMAQQDNKIRQSANINLATVTVIFSLELDSIL